MAFAGVLRSLGRTKARQKKWRKYGLPVEEVLDALGEFGWTESEVDDGNLHNTNRAVVLGLHDSSARPTFATHILWIRHCTTS